MKKLTYIEPHNVIGNVYFVGSKEASCHFIATEDGLILIDTGYEESAEGILRGIEKLGFSPADIKIILHSHGHGDHTAATPAICKVAKDAKTYLNHRDLRYLHGRWTPGYDINDEDIIKLGSTEIRCLFTPGHSEGACSFFWSSTEGGRAYKCGMFGGAGVFQVRRDYMHKYSIRYTQRGDFYRSIDRLMKIRVEAFIGNHVSHNNGMAKAAAKKISYSNPYVNPDEWRAFLRERRGMLDKVIKEEHDLRFVTYAHRGASEYCPENTMLSFYTGMYMGANGIETDVHKTRDGVCVLFHDDTLERVCGVEGRIEDYTYEELQSFDVSRGELKDKIPTLEDFLAHFKSFRALLAIELKGEGCERDVADAIRRHGAERRVIVTSFHLDYLKNIKEYAPELRIGYLTENTDDETVNSLLAIGGEQICPRGDTVTPELVEKWHGLGLDVRAWGITLKNYKAVYDAGVDGMTANFPDLVLNYIKEKRAAAE